MSLKKLLPLLALLGVLVVVAVVQKRQSGPANLADEAGLTALPTAALDMDTIQGIDIHHGTNRQDALRLRRQNKVWVATHYYDAPVQPAKINTLLRVLTHLQGEFRSDKVELLKHFQLESGQAYHLRIFTRSLAQPAVHLLVGKRRSTIGFVRLEDDPRVYSVSSDLFSVLDLQSEQAGGPLATKAWLDLRIQNIAAQVIETFALRTPQRTWQFSRALPANTNKAGLTPQQLESPQWILNQPVVDFPLKQSYVDGLITTLRTLRAEDITTSEQLEAYGLTQPVYEATVSWRTDEGTRQTSIISVGHEVPQQKDKRYARRGHSGPVYILPAWSFKRLFPKPGRLLDLPGLDTQPEVLSRITLTTSGRTVEFERADQPASQDDPPTTLSNWHLTHPSLDLELQQDRFDKWLKHLTGFSPDDLAPESFKPETAQQASGPTIEVVLENGTRNTLRLGPIMDDLPQHHALFFNAFATPFAITQATYQDIFPDLKNILILRPLNTKPNDITHVSWQMGTQRWRLKRSQTASQPADHAPTGAWQFVDAEQVDVAPQQVETVLQQIVGITAEDWVETPEPAWHVAEQPLLLSLGLPDNRTIQLTLMKRDNVMGLMYSNLPGLFILPKDTYASLQASLTALSAVPTSLSTPLLLKP